jgi:hypothetical protein
MKRFIEGDDRSQRSNPVVRITPESGPPHRQRWKADHDVLCTCTTHTFGQMTAVNAGQREVVPWFATQNQ